MTTALVLGGARSGKSRFAEAMVLRSGLLPRTYLATATAGDAEMSARIAEHRSRREGQGWRTIEEPEALEPLLRAEAVAGQALMVDCLTLWLSNIMLAGENVELRSAGLAACLPELAGLVVLVSNEVGMGLVPDTPLGRRFRDAQGFLNQAVAAKADHVVFVAAGLPVTLKGTALP